MPWWHLVSDYLREDKLNGKKNGSRFVPWTSHLKEALFQEAVDFTYFFLGIFTYFYIITLALLYFAGTWQEWHTLSFFIDAMSEPYLGAVGVYVILKESRKRRRKYPSRHMGEFFVFFWLVLFVFSLGSAVLLEEYHLNEALQLIVTNTVAIWLIYFAGIVHKP